ncbi:hypothetical protein EV639_101122 [Rathayibacter tanaceti]|uniref:Uncharacterized protein n=2 Tax=Rathayibacter tanaceti TaxID=1671680 RepID=A0ACD2XN16_9MICO|nr:hypothetical protein ACH61_02367 [Rathayibacter tanaceti]TCO39180.1 hypothetical protein EV639_101122 [Rathayibacter tanaceti]
MASFALTEERKEKYAKELDRCGKLLSEANVSLTSRQFEHYASIVRGATSLRQVRYVASRVRMTFVGTMTSIKDRGILNADRSINIERTKEYDEAIDTVIRSSNRLRWLL